MKLLKCFLICLLAISLNSCKNKSIEFGKSIYYPGFLWIEENQSCAVKTLNFEFSQDAKNDANTFAEFSFVDINGDIIDSNCLQCYINDNKLTNNTFRIDSKTDSVSIRFVFSPNAKDGNYQGYLRLVNHNLDRIDSQKLTSGLQFDVLQWSLTYEKNMNPLVKIICSSLLVFIVILIVWFTFLRPQLYPHFGDFRKIIVVSQNGRTVFNTVASFKGSRKVVLYNANIVQSKWKRIFCGKILIINSQFFTSKIEIVPSKNYAMAIGQNCSISPNPFPKNGIVTIKNHTNNMIINLK